jgi:HSP20 family protein
MFMHDETRRLFDELSRAMGPGYVAGATRTGVFPQVNIYDDGESFLVRAEVAGIDKESLELTTRRDQLTIRGSRTVKAAEEGASYHRRERDSGQFRRTLTLPQPVDGEKVSATYRDGVVEVVLPRAPEAKQRKIPIT